MNVPAYLVYAHPREITDQNNFIQLAAPILSVDATTISAQLARKDLYWVPLARKVDSDKVDVIKNLHLTGIGFEPESKRYYPEATLAAQLLGFVGHDQSGQDKGYFGLEGYYDRELRGKDGFVQRERDAMGAPILIGLTQRVEPENGRTLNLWIDKTIQQIAEKRLSEGISRYQAKEGSVVIMDPETGGILAMASNPSYDPANYSVFDKSLYKNPIVAGSYEPGSTFKVFIMSAAINEHRVTSKTTMDETGPLTIGDYVIRTWNNQYHGTQTMTEVIQHSSNVGMVFVQRKLGKDALLKYIHAFGFGTPTGVDLEEESSPDVRSDNQWGEIDLATASFGQGTAVTPLQMVRAVSVIANGGWLVEPHVVRSIVDSHGRVIQNPVKRISRILSNSTTDIMTEMMVNAVDNGEAKWAKPPGYRIAGKTGTAQIPVAGHYDENKTIASFIGFAPADHPQFAMLVTLREPSTSPWGSETAAPLFFSIAKDILIYKGIPPAIN
jgi:cell division protein FtsI/penicillin-binding protein 2